MCQDLGLGEHRVEVGVKSLVKAEVQEVVVSKTPLPPLDRNLYECVACSSKSGTPALCPRCLFKRQAAGNRWKGPLPSLERREVAEYVVTQLPPKNEVEHGDVFLDLANDEEVKATTSSDSSGWRYLECFSEDGHRQPAGSVPDSDLLDPRLFRFLYHV